MVTKNKFLLSDKASKYLPGAKPNETIDSLDHETLVLLIEEISEKSLQENISIYGRELGLSNTHFQGVDSTLATGYLYHNHRGKGLELQKSPIDISKTTNRSQGLKSTPRDVLKIVNSSSQNGVEIAGYLENDGFSYSIVKNPQSKMAIIVLSNRRHPVASEISSSIFAILNDEKYRLPLQRKQFEIDKDLLKNYAGFYLLNEKMELEVLCANDSLFVLMGPNKIHLIPQSENQFYMEQMDASMRFLRDTNNNIGELELLDGFLDGNKIKRMER